MIIASDAGGGTDLMGRLVARYLEKYLPGRPTFIEKNMGAGAGKVLAMNYMATAKGDGLTVLQTDSDTLQSNLLKLSAVRYEPAQFRAIGAISRGGSIVFIRKDAVARLKNPSAAPVIVGATDGQRSWQAIPVWGKAFLGWNVRWVKGYKGSGQMTLALRKGEIDIFATNGLNVIDPLRNDGVIDFLVQQGQIEGNSYGPRTTFKDVPIFPVLLKNAKIPDVAYQAYRSVIAPSDIDKWIALPPKTPDDILSAYRAAFDKVRKDPEFLASLHKQISEEIYFSNGDEVEQAIRDVRTVSPEASRYADDLRAKYGLITK
jgi:tripartite-type tricarboxylate transporter receptor subunit TctC